MAVYTVIQDLIWSAYSHMMEYGGIRTTPCGTLRQILLLVRSGFEQMN